jgi:hypothetical protein
MEAIDVFFSGTPQQFADVVNSLVGSRLLPETGKIIFNVASEDRTVLIEVQTPDAIEHARGVSLGGSYIAEIKAHTVPAGACVTLRCKFPEYEEAARHWWEVLLARLRFEGWRVWTTGEPAQVKHVKKLNPPGHPPLKSNDLIRRLALAEEAEEIRQGDPSLYWKEIGTKIKWPHSNKLLEDARKRLIRLHQEDPDGLLEQVAEYRKTKKPT